MADKRISGLTAMTTASKDDILLVVDDPAGTPTNKKITIEKFFANVESTSLFANLTPASNSTTAAVVLNGGLGITKNLIVDSGNVSFYNETSGKGIMPTPVIGGVGLIENYENGNYNISR